MSTEQENSEGHGVGVGESVAYPSHRISPINHESKLLECLKNSLFSNPEYADVHLIVEGVRFPAHKCILAARSDYFRAMFFGGMKEAREAEVELKGVSITAFKALLKYVYTGQLSLSEIKEDVILDLLGLCHQYQGGFEELEASICDNPEAFLNIENVCEILDMALARGMSSLIRTACLFGDTNAKSLLEHSTFSNLSPAGVIELLSRDSFFAEEEKIFQRVAGWIRHNENHPDASAVLKNVRLSLLSIETLIGTVKPIGLVHFDDIFDAIMLQETGGELQYRTCLILEENVAHMAHGATVVWNSKICKSYLDGYANYKGLKCPSPPMITDKNELVIILGQQYILNHVRMLFWQTRMYSFNIEVSVDQVNWVGITDYREYHCSTYQYIFFPERVVRFIKILGTDYEIANSLQQVEAFYTMKEFLICPQFGISCAKEDLPKAENGCPVIQGAHTNMKFDLDPLSHTPRYRKYSKIKYFTDGSISVRLSESYALESMEILLYWDGDDASYSYKIEVSRDKAKWDIVHDMSQEICESPQDITFSQFL